MNWLNQPIVVLGVLAVVVLAMSIVGSGLSYAKRKRADKIQETTRGTNVVSIRPQKAKRNMWIPRFRKPYLVFLAIMALLIGSVLFSPARYAETVEFNSGNVRVVDADTLAIGSTLIRLKGIAAPERGHPTFANAKDYVGRLLRASERTVCDLTHERSFGRRVGRCYFVDESGNRIDVQREVVAEGFARPCMRFGGWRYYFVAWRNHHGPLPMPSYCLGFSIH
ncbi:MULTISPECIES: thermonuclease family protein [unclassified Ruegeria]|uniref:thermonuclease family protein n=1 Tax=unclassified Ruegeria TaxID=2625375 RepID=UPI00149325A4|nr:MULTISPECIES: thermonuclease family protein [unclassified Ruegeria]NOD88364.1 hypothetical protein [Ruegeria sp. HKCCD4318]NOE13273.1 hypothetical protein [Ruegeria sp. HKCCD4318-2]NOG11185.1 thermonuclease family protein [Ruegeria sp. HKCCD4315]